MTIIGDPTLSKSLALCKTFCKMLQQEVEDFLVQLADKVDTNEPPKVPVAIQVILDD